jgi:hypothetical protein
MLNLNNKSEDDDCSEYNKSVLELISASRILSIWLNGVGMINDLEAEEESVSHKLSYIRVVGFLT